MGVISLDSYIRKKFPNSVRYQKIGRKIPIRFKLLALDANPFVYSAAARAFETGHGCILKQHDHLSFEEKIQLTFDFTWEEICKVVLMVECDEIFVAFDG